MARNGYLIFDSDTHVGPNMDVLDPYLSAADKTALESVSKFKRGNRYMIGERKYDRRLGDAEPKPADPNAYMSGLFQGSHKGKTPARDGDANPASRPGLALSLADKLDSLVGLFAVGAIPTGSADPYGLRRAAHWRPSTRRRRP